MSNAANQNGSGLEQQVKGERKEKESHLVLTACEKLFSQILFPSSLHFFLFLIFHVSMAFPNDSRNLSFPRNFASKMLVLGRI